MTKYYLIGPAPGTNLLKKVGAVMYCLNWADEWEYAPGTITYLQEPNTEELTEEQAKEAWARITGGKAWTP